MSVNIWNLSSKTLPSVHLSRLVTHQSNCCCSRPAFEVSSGAPAQAGWSLTTNQVHAEGTTRTQDVQVQIVDIIATQLNVEQETRRSGVVHVKHA